jgi:hypothetical protein
MAMSASWSFDVLLHTLVQERIDDNTEAIALGGSYARGTATVFSDIDIAQFVRVLPDHGRKAYSYRDSHMVNISLKSLHQERAALQQPDLAIWLVPSYRDLRILYDRNGALAAFIQDIRVFVWEPLQAAADALVSYGMMIESEFPYKILSALQQENIHALAYETMNLINALTRLIAIQRGIMIESNSTYFQQVQQTLGVYSTWTRYHQIALGLDELPSPYAPLMLRGIATLHLFVESAKLFQPILLPPHHDLVMTTANAVADALASFLVTTGE